MSDLGTLEIVELENSLNDELECQSTHADPRNLVCTEIVTHRLTTCIGQKNVCLAHAEYIVEYEDHVCDICDDYCPSVRPI